MSTSINDVDKVQIVGSDKTTVWNPAAPAAPTGSATSALQTTGNTSLASIDAKIGSATLPSASFTRPNDSTPYTIGDLVANNTVAGSVVPLSFTVARVAAGSGMLRRATLRKSGTSITNASFRLHLYGTSPTAATGDNAAWSTNQVATYLGAFDLTMDRAFTDGALGTGVPVVGSEITFALASGLVVYGLTEARGAYTPVVNEVFTWSLEDLTN